MYDVEALKRALEGDDLPSSAFRDDPWEHCLLTDTDQVGITNGHLIVVVDGYTAPDGAKIARESKASKLIHGMGRPRADRRGLDWGAVSAKVDAVGGPACPSCKGARRVTCDCTKGRRPCRECDGHGKDDSCPCPNCDGHECDECGGTGTRPCEECKNGLVPCGACADKVIGVAIGPAVFDARLLRTIFAGSASKRVEAVTGAQLSALSIFGDGWMAAVMPVNIGTADVTAELTAVSP